MQTQIRGSIQSSDPKTPSISAGSTFLRQGARVSGSREASLRSRRGVYPTCGHVGLHCQLCQLLIIPLEIEMEHDTRGPQKRCLAKPVLELHVDLKYFPWLKAGDPWAKSVNIQSARRNWRAVGTFITGPLVFRPAH